MCKDCLVRLFGLPVSKKVARAMPSESISSCRSLPEGKWGCSVSASLAGAPYWLKPDNAVLPSVTVDAQCLPPPPRINETLNKDCKPGRKEASDIMI